MEKGKCPICGRADAEILFKLEITNPDNSKTYCNCPRCFEFVIVNNRSDLARNPEESKLKPYLAFYLRRHQSGVQPQITISNWKELALAEKAVTVPQKLERLLQLIADRTEVPGEAVHIDREIDAPLFNALSANEVNYLLKSLQDSQFVDLSADIAAKMKVKGWQQLMPSPGSGGIPGTCFVAMSFDPALNSVFDEAIYPAAKDCGFEANRIDKKPTNGDINDHILAEIKKSQFVIADFTRHSPGVYFEAGFARGLGREVIWCCQETDFKGRSHFDVNHYGHILWSNNADLKRQLTERILVTIPNAKASA